MLLGLLVGALPGTAIAAAAGSAPAAVDGPLASAKPYRDRSDAELTALAADWDALDRQQRRALLTEMKLRMARRGEEGKGVIHIRTERRYGRLIRQSDGRVIRIETQVVHVRPLAPGEELRPGTARQGFGVGFEQRVARRTGDVSAADAETAPDLTPSTIGEMLEGLDGEPVGRRAPLPIYQVADPAP